MTAVPAAPQPPPAPGQAAAIARAFHEAYERLAPEFGYRTREAYDDPAEEPRATGAAAAATEIREARDGC